MLVVFLWPVLYESWTIPVAVLLTVPLGTYAAAIAANLRGLPPDVSFNAGLIAIICCLATRGAILIIEFAKDLGRMASSRSRRR